MTSLHAMFTNNCILLQLPENEAAGLSPDFDLVTLSARQILYRPGDLIEHLYFPEQCLASVLTIMADGRMSEAAMIGFEGVVGMLALLGIDTSAQHLVVQMPGKALRIATDQCKAAFLRYGSFRDSVLRFVGCYTNLCAQTAACNRLHTALQRCARWLLMASDRAQSPMIPSTQESLSAVLGVRRTGITAILQQLQRPGLIERRQGRITIVDHAGLEAVACECYRFDRDQLRSLLQPS